MKTTSYRSTYTVRGTDPLNFKFCSMSIPLTVANFFQNSLLHKNWRGGGALVVKNAQYMVTPTNDVIAQAGFTLSWTPGTLGFLKYFLAKHW